MTYHEGPLVVAGLMSGTSVDGLDAAVVALRREGDTLVAQLLGYHETPFEEGLKARVHALFDAASSSSRAVCEANVELGEAFAAAAEAAQRRAGIAVDLVASHGQTVWHQVAPGTTRSTLQLGEPAVLAERLGVTVVADFRPRDMAAGGQGAPLSSWPDALLFGDARLARAVQNVGGMGNVTWVPPGADWSGMLAFDTGPGNALIDAAVRRLTGGRQAYDHDGALAAVGREDEGLLTELLAHPYFAAPPPKSTGRELFGDQMVGPWLERAQARGLGDADAVRTLTAFTARSIADQYARWLPRRPDEVVVGGGGVRNPVLMGLLGDLLRPARVRSSDEFGIGASAREAVYFAVMGYESLHGRPNTIPACTGAAHATVLGTLVPGANYRALAARAGSATERPATRLLIEA